MQDNPYKNLMAETVEQVAQDLPPEVVCSFARARVCVCVCGARIGVGVCVLRGPCACAYA